MHRHSVLAIAIAALAIGSAGAQETSGAMVRSARERLDATAAASRSMLDDVRRGWHFFDDPEPEASEDRAQAKLEQSPAGTKADADSEDLRRFDAMQRRLEDYRKIAVLNPTDRNVRRYMEMENRVFRMAGRFSDVSQRVAWSTPELDMSLQGRPINARAIDVFDKVQASQRQDSIAALAKSHVLFFFFRSDCPYCHAFSPTLRAFEGKSGIKVVPVSLDGGGLPAYPEPRRDNGIATTLQVTQVPALYLAEPSSGKITPIGFGILSESQLVERISTVSAPGAEATLPSATRRIRLQ
jgi:conjugal transfer pilus assembly protein TraF